MKPGQLPNNDILSNERGMVLMLSLVMLMLLSIIGTAAIDTSKTEMMISSIEKDRQGAFFAAEGGIEHARAMLMSLFVARNALNLATSVAPDWDFAVNGSEPGRAQADGTDFAGGALWINNADGGFGHTYSVTVWNNVDAGNSIDDTDGLLYVRSSATGPGGASVAIEVLIQGDVTNNGSLSGYAAQAGAGSSKAYTNDDVNSITTFDDQL